MIIKLRNKLMFFHYGDCKNEITELKNKLSKSESKEFGDLFKSAHFEAEFVKYKALYDESLQKIKTLEDEAKKWQQINGDNAAAAANKIIGLDNYCKDLEEKIETLKEEYNLVAFSNQILNQNYSRSQKNIQSLIDQLKSQKKDIPTLLADVTEADVDKNGKVSTFPNEFEENKSRGSNEPKRRKEDKKD